LASRLLEKGPVIRRYHAPTPPAASWLVRYQFESAQSLVKHLSLAEGFFVPRRPLPGNEGARVIVEIGLPDSVHRCLHGRLGKSFADGVWVEAPSARSLARRALERPTRLHRRLACDLVVEAGHAGAEPWMYRALDLSAGGLEVSAGTLELGMPGDEVKATLLAREAIATVRAKIVWSGTRSSGLQLLDADASFGNVLLAVEDRWRAAQEITHDDACICADPLRRAG
jgi:hypothetical protein